MGKFAISALSDGLLLDMGEYGIRTINDARRIPRRVLGANMVEGEPKTTDYDAKREAFFEQIAT